MTNHLGVDTEFITVPKRTSTLSADYVLEYKNRKLAVIEAKKSDLTYNEGVGQAKDYAQRLNIRHTYSTNGKRIYAIDMEEGKEGEVSVYPTPSKKLSTGVDAPEIRHIVLLRDVKSMVEFKQIVGRGTRLFDEKD